MAKSVEEIVKAVGGTNKAADLVGVGASAVSMWKAEGSIPSKYWLKFREELGDLPPELFGFEE